MSRLDAALRAALIQDLLAQARGRPADLLPFDDVREKLRLRNLVDRGVQKVPLERIVGTVQREREFNRAFLPRDESLRSRWKERSLRRAWRSLRTSDPSLELNHAPRS